MTALLMIFAALAAPTPVESVWIRSPRSPSPAMERIMPEVHSVTVEADSVVVRSAGISMRFLGPLQGNPAPPQAPREYVIRVPRYPHAASKHPVAPADITGVFVNGVPIHNQSQASYEGRNLWHFDAQFAERVPESERHSLASGALEEMSRSARAPAIIGYAVDGFPIYGPSATGRMHSSYRLRRAGRTSWPDGTHLTPAQYGPAVSAEFPLGTFAEDYEYVPGLGDLDEFNGKFVKTAEYPAGTYAYFLSSDDSGKLTFPYVTPARLYGELLGASAPALTLANREGLVLRADTLRPVAGTPVTFSFLPANPQLEYVHERAMHLIIVSDDLVDFEHVHPALAGDDYRLAYTFRRGGKYRAFLDYTPPGSDTRVEAFDFDVEGPPRGAQEKQPAPELNITMEPAGKIRAGRDTLLKFSLPAVDLEPYLGAWAHFMIVSEDLGTFIHAHPLDAMPTSGAHVHCAAMAANAPAPSEVSTSVNLPKPGRYKLWVQVQRRGEVITMPFTLTVAR